MSSSSSMMKVCIVSGVDASAGGEVMTLSNARGARPYLLSSGRVLEFTRASPAVAAPSSWLVGDGVAADGSVLVVSPVDVIFFLLPLLEAGGVRWCSAGQLVAGAGSGAAALARATDIWERIGAVCDIYGEDGNGKVEGERSAVDAETLVRFNRTKALKLLVAKVHRVAVALDSGSRSRASLRATAASGAGFFVESASAAAAAPVLNPSDDAAKPTTSPPPIADLISALSIIENVLTDAWVASLSVELGCVAARQSAKSIPFVAQLTMVLGVLESIQTSFNGSQSDKKVSIADLIVLAGNVGVEKAASNAGLSVNVPFIAGRTDASQEQTEIHSFQFLEPLADGFRNYSKTKYIVSAEDMLLDKAHLLNLTAPEMTVLVGGMRVLNTNFDQSQNGVFTKHPESLTNDFFVNLLDLTTTWKAVSESNDAFIGTDRNSGSIKWFGTRIDLIFGSNTELRAIAEVYGSSDSKEKFVKDFIAAWNKVMNLDRFNLN